MMKILGAEFTLKKMICLVLYYGIATHLPDSYSSFGGKISNSFRVFLCKRIFKQCGNIRTINRKVNFGSGKNIEMGDDSGIGANTEIPSDTVIGKYVMLSRRCFVLHRNHEFSRTDIPIIEQGFKETKRLVIEDDCWVGLGCILTPGRHIKKGTIVAMGSVLTKDFPEYSIVGGNPAKLIKIRNSSDI